MKFLKYRHKFAHGYNNWEYKNIPAADIDFVEDMLSELSDEYSYSDKYRGIDYEIIDDPPNEWLSTQITLLQNGINFRTQLIEQYRKKIARV